MDLNKRMKQYEACYKTIITPKSYIIIRLDGKNFSKYTKKLVKPFDEDFSEAMNETAMALCDYFNAKFAYTQSDEISLLITEIGGNVESQPELGNVLQKLCSLTASVATAKFNEVRNRQNIRAKFEDYGNIPASELVMNCLVFPKQAFFDSRVFVVPNEDEVMNHMVWRNRDCVRNSISMAAQSVYSHKELQSKNSNEQQEMLFQKGINWSKYPSKFKDGLLIVKEEYEKVIEDMTMDRLSSNVITSVKRKKWVKKEYSTDLVKSLIPLH